MADIVITEVLDPETIASLSRDYEVHYDPELVHKLDEGKYTKYAIRTRCA